MSCSIDKKIISMEIIDNKLIGELLAKAGASARLRQNLDLRTSGADGSQRMLNALLPGTRVPDSIGMDVPPVSL